MRSLIASFTLALAIAVPLVVFSPASPAHADEFDDYIAWSDIGTVCGENTVVPTQGGWDTRRLFSVWDNSPSANLSEIREIKPKYVTLLELCRLNSTNLAIRFIATGPILPPDDHPNFYYSRASITVNGNPYISNGMTRVGDEAPGPTLVCRNTPTGSNFDRTGIPPHQITNFPMPSVVTYGSAYIHTASSAFCPYLVELRLKVVRPVTETTYREEVVTWSAARFNSGHVYDAEVPPGLEEWCSIPGNEDELICFGLNEPNYSSWDDTCGDVDNADVYGLEYVAWNPLDGDTWGPSLSWNLVCLFMPLGGVNIVAEEGLSHSYYISLMFALSDSMSSGPTPDQCGLLFSAPDIPVLSTLSIDSCAWSSWAGPIRFLLSGLGVIMIGYWLLTRTLDALLALVSKKAPEVV